MNTSEVIKTLADKMQGWLVAFIQLLPNIVLALLLLLGVYFIAQLLERLSRKYLVKARLTETISRSLSSLLSLIGSDRWIDAFPLYIEPYGDGSIHPRRSRHIGIGTGFCVSGHCCQSDVRNIYHLSEAVWYR